MYAEQRDFNFMNDWQRMRILATLTIQPHLAKGKKVTPEKLLPFPWDKKKTRKRNAKEQELTPQKQRERMAELVKKLGDTMI